MSEERGCCSVLRDKAARVRADEPVFKATPFAFVRSAFVPDNLVEAADATGD